MQRRWRALAPVIGVVALVVGLFGFAPMAAAQTTPTTSTVTLVHAILDTPVDVYVDGTLVSDADGFAPTEFLPLGALTAGDYAVQVFAHDATPAPADPATRTDAALITQTLTVPAGLNLSVVAQALPSGTATPDLVLTPFVNDLSIVPAGQARLSVRHNANAGPVDVYANDVLIVEGLPSGEKSDQLVPAGAYDLEVFEAGADPVTATPVTAAAGVVIDPERLEAVYIASNPAGDTFALFTRDPLIPSSVTILHLIPNTPVDVYVAPDGTDPALLIPGFVPLTTFPVAGGLDVLQDILVYEAIPNPPATASARVDPVVIDGSDTAVPGNLRLSVAAHYDAAGVPTLTAFVNDVSPVDGGFARLSVRHTAEFGPFDVYAGGTTADDRIVTNLANPDAVDIEVPALGTVPAGGIIAVPTGADPADPATPRITNPGPLTIEAGFLYGIYAVGTPDDTPSSLQLFVRSVAIPSLVNPLTPVRIIDTRDGTGGVPIARLMPDEVLRVSVNGLNGVPNTGAAAVALNVTAAAPSADGFIKVYPCAATPPDVSNVNFVANEIAAPNAVITSLTGEGDFCVSGFAETDVVIDLTAWFAAGSGFNPQTPVRIADTRTVSLAVPRQPLEPGQVLTVDVSDDPAVGAAVLNVTAANTTAPGYLTVYPCTTSVPYASNVNYEADQAGQPNAVLTALDAEGQVCITTFATVDIIVDLFATFDADSAFIGLEPERIADTRDGLGGVPVAKLAPGTVLTVDVIEGGGELLGVNTVALNVTATEADANGYLTVYPCDAPGGAPYASSVNYTSEELSSPNAVISGLSDAGTVCITSFAPVNVVVDITGVFTN